MRKFLINILIFTTIPLTVYLLLGVFLKLKLQNEIDKHQIIILGDSQTEFIKSPKIYNHSIAASPYYVHFEFAKDFIKQLKNKKIYIGYNYHNLSKLYQNRLTNDTLYPGWRQMTFNSLNEYHLFSHKYSDIFPKGFNPVPIDIKKYPRLINTMFFKVPENTNESVINDTLSIDKTIRTHWKNPNYKSPDLIQNKYLNMLIALLIKNNCEVILLKMPVTNYYLNNVPDEIKSNLTKISSKYKIRLLDLNSCLSISKRYAYFKDYGHLNTSGNSIVINFLNNTEIETPTHHSQLRNH